MNGNIQRYISDELTHFIGRQLESDEQRYELLVTIITEGILGKKNKLGLDMIISSPDTHFASGNKVERNVTCFCDIPVADFHIHMQKYGRFGIGFSKSHLADRGANPVYYIVSNADGFQDGLDSIQNPDETQTRIDYFDRQISRWLKFRIGLLSYYTDLQKKNEVPDVLKELMLPFFGITDFISAHFLSFTKPFHIGLPEDHIDNYYMEREWRIPGAFEFKMQDIRRIIIPEEYAGKFRQDFPTYLGQLTFS